MAQILFWVRVYGQFYSELPWTTTTLIYTQVLKYGTILKHTLIKRSAQ